MRTSVTPVAAVSTKAAKTSPSVVALPDVSQSSRLQVSQIVIHVVMSGPVVRGAFEAEFCQNRAGLGAYLSFRSGLCGC